MELVESIVHPLDLSGYSEINRLPSEWPIVAGENLDIEIDCRVSSARDRA